PRGNLFPASPPLARPDPRRAGVVLRPPGPARHRTRTQASRGGCCDGGDARVPVAQTAAGDRTPAVSIRFYMDVHVPRAITEGLRLRGIDVVTAQEDGATR